MSYAAPWSRVHTSVRLMLDLSKAYATAGGGTAAPAGIAPQGVPPQRVLNENASGTTWLAFDLAAPTPGAISIKRYNLQFTKYLTSSSPITERLAAFAGRRIPGLPTIVRAGITDGELVLVLEGFDGESLDQVMTSHAVGLGSTAANSAIERLASALARMHSGSLLHLDVHPGAIVFDRDEQQAAFIDWGHTVPLMKPSEAASGLPKMGFAGLAYTSPQLLAGEPPHPSDDVFSLACVAYELVCGQHPFGRRSGIDAANFGLQPAPVRGLGEASNKTLLRALALHREDRTVTAEELAAAFARPPMHEPRAPRPGSFLHGTAFGLALSLGVAVSGLLWLNADPLPNRGALKEPAIEPTVERIAVAPVAPATAPEIPARARLRDIQDEPPVRPLDPAAPAISKSSPPPITPARPLARDGESSSSLASAHSGELKTYANDRYGFVFKYPASLVAGRPPAHADGVELHSPNEEFSVLAVARSNPGHDTIQQYWEENLKRHGHSVTYKRKANDWMVVSGVENGETYYKKQFVRAGHTSGFVITYPKAKANVYDPWVRDIEKSFVPLPRKRAADRIGQ